MIKHLSVQSRPNPRGGLHCIGCPNKTWTRSLYTSSTLAIVKNELEMKKLQSPKAKKVKNSNKQTIEHLKHSLYVALLLLKFKDEIKLQVLFL
jgi:hypothetical protein